MKIIFLSLNIVLNVIFSILIFSATCFPSFFGLLTFILSGLVFGKLEYDKNLHEREFYSDNSPNKFTQMFITSSSAFVVLMQSTTISLLSLIIFSGTNNERIASIQLSFLMLIFLGSWVMKIVKNTFKINVERWGYVNLSLLLGIVFSLLLSGVESMNVSDTILSLGKSFFSSLDVNNASELLFKVLSEIDNFIEKVFTNIFGQVIGKIVALIFTINTTLGFAIYVYVVQYVRLQERYENMVARMVSKSKLNSQVSTT